MNALAAERGYGRRRAIAACFAPMARCPVHRCRARPPARRAPLRAARHNLWPTLRSNPRATGWAAEAAACWRGGSPHAAILAGLFVPTPIRVVIWTIALIWMGAACLLNARQCGRTHCRYTGPYYLAMIAPVLVLGSGVVSSGIYEWIALESSLSAAASSFGGRQSGHGENSRRREMIQQNG